MNDSNNMHAAFCEQLRKAKRDTQERVRLVLEYAKETEGVSVSFAGDAIDFEIDNSITDPIAVMEHIRKIWTGEIH